MSAQQRSMAIPCWKCRHLDRPPQSVRGKGGYKGKVGWCMAPTPAWVVAYFGVAQPLLGRKEMRGKTCLALALKQGKAGEDAHPGGAA